MILGDFWARESKINSKISEFESFSVLANSVHEITFYAKEMYKNRFFHTFFITLEPLWKSDPHCTFFSTTSETVSYTDFNWNVANFTRPGFHNHYIHTRVSRHSNWPHSAYSNSSHFKVSTSSPSSSFTSPSKYCGQVTPQFQPHVVIQDNNLCWRSHWFKIEKHTKPDQDR